jgi:hypothetical protein
MSRPGRQRPSEKETRSHNPPYPRPSRSRGLGFYSLPGQLSVTARPLIPVSFGSRSKKMMACIPQAAHRRLCLRLPKARERAHLVSSWCPRRAAALRASLLSLCSCVIATPFHRSPEQEVWGVLAARQDSHVPAPAGTRPPCSRLRSSSTVYALPESRKLPRSKPGGGPAGILPSSRFGANVER